MKIVIVGGSGFIGSELSRVFLQQGHSVVSWDMNPPRVSGVGFAPVSKNLGLVLSHMVSHPDVVINLAGRSIVGPWNKAHKQAIYTTRIETTRALVGLCKHKDFRPKVFIQASAVGIYGTRKNETLSEGSPVGDTTFLSHVARDWEHEASLATLLGIRTVIVRQANVLGKDGLLKKLYPLYQKHIGGPIGSGSFWFPWIHIADLVRIYNAIIHNPHFEGIVNAVAPEVVEYKMFSQLFARTLHRLHLFRIPFWLFRILYRGFAYEITASQKVVSLRLWELGNVVRYTTLQDALRDILGAWNTQ